MDSIVLQPLLYPPLPSELTRNDFRLEKLFADKKTNSCTTKQKKPDVPYNSDNSVLSIDERSTVENLQAVERILFPCTEVTATLLFSNGSTLLNESSSKGKEVKIEALCLYVDHSSSPYLIHLHFVPLYLSTGRWIKSTIAHLLSSAIVIGYQMNEILCTVISHFELPGNSILGWRVYDVGMASLLTQPDDPVHSFTQLLKSHTIPTSETELLSAVKLLMSRLHNNLCKNNLWTLFTNLEMKLLPLVSVMESIGLEVDIDLLHQHREVLKVKVYEIEQTVYSIVGYSFMINSVQQLRKVLYDELKLDQTCSVNLAKTAVGGYTSTSEATLIRLQSHHPLPKLILEYRQMCKLKSLVESLMQHARSNNGFLKSCWQSIGTATGRITCSNPNVQAMPKLPTTAATKSNKIAIGLEPYLIDIRSAIISRQNYTFVVSDFRSIELCLLAHVSGDHKLISVLNNATKSGKDIFKSLASEWLGMREESVTHREREKTKRVVYSLIYGMGKEKLSQLLGISPESAQNLTANFLSKYRGIKDFITNTIERCRKTRFCSTLCGRLRWFDNISSSNYVLRTSAERQCVNFVIQGSAADVCKLSMLRIHEAITKNEIDGRLLIQVHDELVYEVLDAHVQCMIERLKEIVESKHLLADYTCSELSVPLSVKVFAGKRWSNPPTPVNE